MVVGRCDVVFEKMMFTIYVKFERREIFANMILYNWFMRCKYFMGVCLCVCVVYLNWLDWIKNAPIRINYVKAILTKLAKKYLPGFRSIFGCMLIYLFLYDNFTSKFFIIIFNYTLIELKCNRPKKNSISLFLMRKVIILAWYILDT